MGLDINGTKFLLFVRERLGVSFKKTAMIGRQKMNLTGEALGANLEKFGVGGAMANEILAAADGYAEPFFEMLGADEISSFDASDYENATFVHDFNQPIPDEFKNKFTAVLDGGTLEHIFNFPLAIKNCMEMVAVGGHFLAITPTNNYLGHGFYQFSPELFFRIFNKENGYEMRKTIIFEDHERAPWFEVVDPDEINERVTLLNSMPSYLLIVAEKTADVPIFEKTPQQSDYSAMWNEAKNGAGDKTSHQTHGKPPAKILRLPRTAIEHLRQNFSIKYGNLTKRRRHFKRMDDV